ncbi:MAG: peptidylprolyl isomerase, partial [Elusimicrobia bacterium]|nr:peptidylprolyl isomerase [Elusimicrobiota bacterium]
PSTAPHRGYYAVITTDRGVVEAFLYQDEAPKTVEEFRVLASTGAYDGRPFERAVPGFLVQAAASSAPAEPLPLETNPGRVFDAPGRLAAPAVPGGSAPGQFFVTLTAAPWLDGKNCVFGTVTQGLEVLRDAAAGPRQERAADGSFADRPLHPLVIRSIRVEDRR